MNDKGKAAVVKVVESRAELYSLDKNEDASLGKLQQMDVSLLSKQRPTRKNTMQNRTMSNSCIADTSLRAINFRNSQSVSLGLSSSVQSTFLRL